MIVFPLGTIYLGIKPNMLVPAVMRVPTPFAKRPSSFTNEVCHVVDIGSFMRCLYSSDAPVVGSRTELIVWVDYWNTMMFAAVEYLDDACGWWARLIRPVFRQMCRVGYLFCVWM